MNIMHLALWRKPRRLNVLSRSTSLQEVAVAAAAEEEKIVTIPRSLGLFDLIMIGIGGTVGTGVFATSGLIASSYAGPAATLSWFIAGIGCLLSGLSFMELACIIPTAGSTYAYAYYALGELPALIAGFLLTLEYGVSSAGGARSWSDKFTQWIDSQFGIQGPSWMKPKDSVVDLYAGLLMAGSTVIVLCGMKAGKFMVNVVTMTKIIVVVFIIVIGLAHFDVDKIIPFVPDQTIVQADGKDHTAFGWPGILVGTSASFYGYIGYDEVCCLAGEAKDPAKNIPRAVIWTIAGAATLSILATFALVGMQSYTEIDAKESYANAFTSVGLDWAASLVASGEVLTMPVTSFIGFLAQPRVQYAMAKDGLLPPVFAEVDTNGELFRGTLLCGIGVTLLAVFVPFHVLWSFISLGILVAFNLTNSSLLFVRASNNSYTRENEMEETLLKHSHGAVITGYVVSSFLAAFHWQNSVVARIPLSATTDSSIFDSYMQTIGPFVAAFFTIVAIALMFALNGTEMEQAVTKTTAAARDAKAQSQDFVEIALCSKKQQDTSAFDRVSCHNRNRSLDLDDDSNTLKTEGDDKMEHPIELSERTSCFEQDNIHSNGATVDSSESDESDDDKIDSSSISYEDANNEEESAFRAPFVPFVPCVAIFFNWFLFVQMDCTSVVLILLWLLLAVAVYFGYSRHHSLAFQQAQYHGLAQH